MATGLTTKQTEELNRAILGYFELQGYHEIASSFAQQLNLPPTDTASKDALPRKWRSILRLQKKVTDLENELNDLRSRNIQSIVPSSTIRDTLPRPAPVYSLQGHRKLVTRLAYHPLLTHLISSSDDGTVRVWDMYSAQTVKLLNNGHTDSVTALVLSPDVKTLVTCSNDLSVKLWRPEEDYTLAKTLQGHTHTVSDAAFISDTLLATCSRDGSVRVWDTKSGYCLRTLRGQGAWVRCVSAPHALNQKYYYGVQETNAAAAVHVSSVAPTRGAYGHGSTVSASTGPGAGASTPSAQRVAGYVPVVVTGDAEGVVAVWDVSNASAGAGAAAASTNAGGCVQLLAGHEHVVQRVLVVDSEMLEKRLCVAFGLQYSAADATPTAGSSKGTGAAEGGSGDARAGEEGLPQGPPLLPGRFVLSCSRDKTLRLWDRQTAQCVHVSTFGNWVSDVAVHPNEKYLLVSCDDKHVRVLDACRRMREVAKVKTGGFAGALAYCRGLDLLGVALSDNSVSVLKCEDMVENMLRHK